MSDTKVPKYYLTRPDNMIRRMFGLRGFDRVQKIEEADFIVFPGGADVNPFLYGEIRLPTTCVSFGTDLTDIQALRKSSDGQIKIGICRGAQFLNVMVGNGKLYQHVNNHATPKGHMAYEPFVKNSGFVVSSTHHQMMIPGSSGLTLLAAKEATRKESDFVTELYDDERRKTLDDVECVYYSQENALCFQPHPEYEGYKECTDWFFDQLECYFMTNAMILGAKEMARVKATHT